jgi:inositol-pentakisphosphate 2-kinase
VQQRLVKLPQDPAFIDSLNQQLEQIEQKGTRRHDFAGHRFVPEGMKTGMLVEDMRPRAAVSSRPSSSGPGKGKGKAKGEEADAHDGDDLFTLHEIKPKWLHQSPRAPEGAEQCRNCAREVQRNLKNGTRNPVFCPLNLVKATDFPRNQHVAGDIRRALGLSAAQSDNLQAWLRGSTLLARLRARQWDLDHAGEKVVPSASSSGILSSVAGSSASSAPVSSGAAEDEQESDNVAKYCLAMTVRDCSLFLRIPRRPGAAAEDVVAKLADLDKKNYGTKHEYWEGMEDGLHQKNLYWKSGADGVSAELTDCQLPFYKAGAKNLPPEVREYYRL